jgi:UrcA family protein
MKTITTLAALLAASLATAIAPAAAQQQPVRSVAVSYADLDLRSDAGRATLDHRLRIAIRDVCGQASSADLAGQNAVADCRRSLGGQVAAQREAAFAAARPGGAIVLAAR